MTASLAKAQRRWSRHLPNREWLLKSLATIALIFLIDLVVSIANPFGMDDAIKRHAGEIMQLVASSSYESKDYGQRVVTVVTIDSGYFEATASSDDASGMIWPLPVRELTGIASRIVRARPAALFIDLGFPDAPRETKRNSTNSRTDALAELTTRLRALDPSVPIFLADDVIADPIVSRSNRDCDLEYVPDADLIKGRSVARSLREGLYKPGDTPPSHIEFVDASWNGDPAAYPLFPSRTGKQHSCETQKAGGRGLIVSPGFALLQAYATHCRSNQHLPACSKSVMSLADIVRVDSPDPQPLDGFRPRILVKTSTGELPPLPAPMAIRWGFALSDQMRDLLRQGGGADDCVSQIQRGWLGEAVALYFVQMLAPIRERFGKPASRRCAYIDSISAGRLFDERRYSDPIDAADPRTAAQKFITDRIVLLGVDLPTSSDVFASPVNGTLPGVFNHAAATENLVTSGLDYRRANAGFFARTGLVILTTILMLVMKELWDVLCRVFSKRYRKLGRYLIAPTAYCIAVTIVGAIILFILGAFTRLPLADMAMPIVLLHVILFSGVIANCKEDLESWASRAFRPRGHRARNSTAAATVAPDAD